MKNKYSYMVYVLLGLLIMFILFPLAVLLAYSLVPFSNYSDLFSNSNFIDYIKNSLIIASGSTFFCLLFAVCAAYPLARFPVPGGKILMMILLATAIFPQVAIISPLFLVLSKLKLLNTYTGLILIHGTFSLPLAIWLLQSYFKSLPENVEEAAIIDGADIPTLLLSVIFPLAAPGIVTTAILVFIYSWNEFLFALTFNTSGRYRTVTVGLALFPGLHRIPWGTIFAASIVISLPLVISVFIFQKRIISGLTAGSSN